MFKYRQNLVNDNSSLVRCTSSSIALAFEKYFAVTPESPQVSPSSWGFNLLLHNVGVEALWSLAKRK